MIVSFAHKGLERFFRTGSTAGIQAKHALKLQLILKALDSAKEVDDLRCLALNLHALKGDMQGLWSLKVNGNWRITFRFDEGDAEIVDYVDYH